MVEKDYTPDTHATPESDLPSGPEIRAERSERKRFQEARKEHKIISGVRTQIDRDK
ncbi:MAG TPA: hypothetical protein VGJ92_03120 [Methanocella sp.]|jgi:hypothetical protein